MQHVQRLIGALVLFVAMVGGNMVASALVLTVLWGWFVVPTFHLGPLALVPALGLALILRFLTFQSPADLEEVHRQIDMFMRMWLTRSLGREAVAALNLGSYKRTADEHWWRALGAAFGVPGAVLAVGWFLHLFM